MTQEDSREETQEDSTEETICVEEHRNHVLGEYQKVLDDLNSRSDFNLWNSKYVITLKILFIIR